MHLYLKPYLAYCCHLLVLVPNPATLSSVEFSLTFENPFTKFHRANRVLGFYRALSSVSVRTDTLEASVRNLMPATPDPVATTAPAPTLNRGSMGTTSPAPAPQVCSALGLLSVCLFLHPSPHSGPVGGLMKNPEFHGSPGVVLQSAEYFEALLTENLLF